jgi:hypothetical protein
VLLPASTRSASAAPRRIEQSQAMRRSHNTRPIRAWRSMP